MVAPLQGIRVLEMASWVAAPSAAALMADLGADVIKVELPRGDTVRNVVRQPEGPDADPAIDYSFELDNRGKRSVSIAVEKPGGADLVKRLAATADFFVTNLPVKARRKLGLDADAVRAANPRIIDVAVSGYGPDGPGADKLGFDNSAFWAASGAMQFFGPPDGSAPPNMLRTAQGDHITALNLLAASLAALRLRDLTGEGQTVYVTLMETGMWTIGQDYSMALVDRAEPSARWRRHAGNPLSRMYRTGDMRWFIFTMPQSDRFWHNFCEAMGHPEWELDPRYESFHARAQHEPELTNAIKATLSEQPLAYWAPRFEAAALNWSPAVKPFEVVDDPVARHLGIFQTVPHTHTKPFETLGAPFHVVGADIRVRGGAPQIGEHTQEVLRETGLDDAQIAELAAEGLFG